MLIVVSGLPGVGKSAVASAVAAQLGAVHLSIDEVEAALLGAGLPRDRPTGVAAYEAVRAAAEQNLVIGRTVVVDAVNDSDAARDTWRQAARATGTGVRFFLLSPPPEDEHRRRLLERGRGLRHVLEPTWEQVTARAADYEPWEEDGLRVLDANLPLPALIDTLASEIAPKLP